jgi:hypothetical protein
MTVHTQSNFKKNKDENISTSLYDNANEDLHRPGKSSTDASSMQSQSQLTAGAIAAFQQQQNQCPSSPSHNLTSGVASIFGGCGGPSSDDTLQPHPFNVIISDF